MELKTEKTQVKDEKKIIPLKICYILRELLL